MKPQILGAGAAEALICKDNIIPEFPALLFGTSHSDGSQYFDATNYLQLNSLDNLSVEQFFTHFNFQIKAIAESYSIPEQRLVIINTEGHQLIAGCLCYLFISYTQPWFNAYLYDRIDELMINGIVVSDSYLAYNVKQRFSPETIKDIFKDEKGEKRT